MKYLHAFLEGNPDPPKNANTYSQPPTKPTKPPSSPSENREYLLSSTDKTDETPSPFDPADPDAIDIPAGTWRHQAARWPHERWTAWRQRTAELLRPGATADEIREAERRAFEELTAGANAVAEFPDKSLILRETDANDHLIGPRRTPWGTLVWSDPDAPPIESFGE